MKKSVVAVGLTLLSLNLFAIETDQFMSWNVELKDSAPAVSAYIEDKLEEAQKKINKRNRSMSCEDLTQKVFSVIIGELKISEISVWASESPLVDRHPKDSVSGKEVRENSIYQFAQFPISTVGMARNINIGGVYMGTDKLGHFILIGRNYYTRYRRNLKRFDGDKIKAYRKTIKTGIRHEQIFLGYALGGVFSFSDMEANFQGLLFGEKVCNDKESYFTKVDGKWKRNEEVKFDVTQFFNPRFDESYYQSIWKRRVWKSVAKAIKKNYCHLREHPIYLKRMEVYKALDEKFKSKEDIGRQISYEMLEEHKKNFLHKTQTLEFVCD